MKTITLEEHFITETFVKTVTAAGEQIPPQMQAMHEKMLDLGAGRIAAMDEGGINLQILSLAAMGMDRLNAREATPLVADINDELAEAVRANPTRLAGFASLDLKEPKSAAKELERAVTKLGFKGALVDGTTEGCFLDDPRFLPVFETAVHLKVPIYLHPALPPEPVKKAYYEGLPGATGFMLSMAGWGWHSETAIHTLRLIVAGVFDRLPELQLIIGHMGEMLPMALARTSAAVSGSAHLRQTIADYFQSNIHITTSGYFTQPPLKLATEVLGIDRIMYSVDYPFSPTPKGKQFLAEAETWLSPDDLEKLTHTNAEKLLKL